MFTDSHCHIYSEYYDSIDEIIKKSEENDVTRWINNGCNNKSNIEVLSLVSKYNNMYGCLGIHPEDVTDYNDENINFIEKHINDHKIIAIGEIGLDYYYEKENKDIQKELFIKQLDLAKKYNKPVVIHSREATQDTIDILKKYNLKGVIHSFSGSLEVAKEYVKMGYLIGINGVITFKNCKISEVISKISIENIILETDSPYLTPVPFRGQKNDSSHIIDIAKFVANIYKIDINELAKITNNNIKRVFDI